MLYYKVETWKTWKLHYATLQGKKLGKLGKQKKRKLTHHCAGLPSFLYHNTTVDRKQTNNRTIGKTEKEN